MEWTWKVAPANGKFALEVLAEQKDTDFMLSIPVYVKFGGDRGLIRPLPMKGRRGQLQLMLPEKPASVSLNDFYESLVILRKKE